MSSRTIRVALFIVTFLPLLAAAQEGPPVFTSTIISEWNVPRDKWAEFQTYAEKGLRPAADRLVGDGTLTSYGIYETIIHEENGYSHGLWLSAPTIAGVEKGRLELLKTPPPPSLSTARHRDRLMRSSLFKQRKASGTNGYMWVSSQMVQPGKTSDWRAVWEKYTKPTYVDLVDNGTIVSYALQQEQAFTMDPAMRWVAYLAADAVSLDNALLGFLAAGQKRTPQDREALAKGFADASVGGSNRVYLARVLWYSTR